MKHVAEYLQQVSRAAGLSPADMADRLLPLAKDCAHAIVEGRAPLRVEDVATVARAAGADPMLLLRYCLADTAPDTLAAVSDRLDDALTREELQTVLAMRRVTGTPYVTSLAPNQEAKFFDWLRSMRDDSTLVH